jgi:hypothetical protein
LTEPAARPPLTEDPSWVDLIWVQFGKRKVARGALIGLLGLLLLAIYAPRLYGALPDPELLSLQCALQLAAMARASGGQRAGGGALLHGPQVC